MKYRNNECQFVPSAPPSTIFGTDDEFSFPIRREKLDFLPGFVILGDGQEVVVSWIDEEVTQPRLYNRETNRLKLNNLDLGTDLPNQAALPSIFGSEDWNIFTRFRGEERTLISTSKLLRSISEGYNNDGVQLVTPPIVANGNKHLKLYWWVRRLKRH